MSLLSLSVSSPRERSRSVSPDRSRERLLLSLRSIEYFCAWFTIWQGSFLASSPIQLSTWMSLPGGIGAAELMEVVFFFVLLIERTITEDYTLRRSYFSAPILYLAGLVFFSWARGQVMTQRFAFVLEVHDLPEWPIVFLMFNNAFRETEDGVSLFVLLFLVMIPKTFEAGWNIIHPMPRASWGILQSWRDGYLLDVAIVGALVMMHYRGTKLRRLKWFLFAAFPAAEAILILGFRRAAIISGVGVGLAMFVTLPRGRRLRQAAVVGCVLVGFVLFALVTDPVAVGMRFWGALHPSGEGSAYIRLMELPNVLLNIWHHPILGVPFGIPWKTYYRMPISAVYTTLGTHTSYLYWPLRMGIFGMIAFIWIYGSMCKAAILNYRFRRNEEDFFFGQVSIQILIAYFISSFFGLLYADGLILVLSITMVAFERQSQIILGTSNLRAIAFWRSFRTGEIVYKVPLGDRIRCVVFRPGTFTAGVATKLSGVSSPLRGEEA